MISLFSYLKSNYLYLIFVVLQTFLSFILSLILKKKNKSLYLSDQLSRFLVWLPSAIYEANASFPIHGDGAKRLDQVVQLSARQFPSIPLSVIIECVDQILDADSFIKEKGGDEYATCKSSPEDGSSNFQTDGTSVRTCELSSTALPRRSTFLSK